MHNKKKNFLYYVASNTHFGLYWVDDELLLRCLGMEEKPNIHTHESLIPQAFKKKNFETCKNVSQLFG
jgi:hypothetical protein